MTETSSDKQLLSHPQQSSEQTYVLHSNYVLEQQVGFLLRKANQRHMLIFSEDMVGGLTPTQFSTLFRLVTEPHPISQNALGRLVVMDAATTKGVITRLRERGLVVTKDDPKDKRRYLLQSTAKGQALVNKALPAAMEISRRTLAPLSESEQDVFLRLLAKLL